MEFSLLPLKNGLPELNKKFAGYLINNYISNPDKGVVHALAHYNSILHAEHASKMKAVFDEISGCSVNIGIKENIKRINMLVFSPDDTTISETIYVKRSFAQSGFDISEEVIENTLNIAPRLGEVSAKLRNFYLQSQKSLSSEALSSQHEQFKSIIDQYFIDGSLPLTDQVYNSCVELFVKEIGIDYYGTVIQLLNADIACGQLVYLINSHRMFVILGGASLGYLTIDFMQSNGFNSFLRKAALKMESIVINKVFSESLNQFWTDSMRFYNRNHITIKFAAFSCTLATLVCKKYTVLSTNLDTGGITKTFVQTPSLTETYKVDNQTLSAGVENTKKILETVAFHISDGCSRMGTGVLVGILWGKNAVVEQIGTCVKTSELAEFLKDLKGNDVSKK